MSIKQQIMLTFRKLALTIPILVALTHSPAWAQTAVDSSIVDQYLLNFSVPDMPAFKALDIDPSNLLRPSDVKKFAAMISPFHTNGKAVIPKNFALEFAPWKIASATWKLTEYDRDGWKRFRYNSAFSLGTIRDSGQTSSKISVGYRVSFLSKKADILRSEIIRDYYFGRETIGSKAEILLAALKKLKDDWVATYVSPAIAPGVAASEYEKIHDNEFNKFMCSIKAELAKNPNPAVQNDLSTMLAAYKTLTGKDLPDADLCDVAGSWNKAVNAYVYDYKKKYWNASRFDLAIAWVGQSNDTLVKNAAFSSFSLWAAYAIRLGDGKQLVLGVNPSLPRSESKDSTRFNFAGNARLYIGSKDFRGFIEGQYKYKRFDANANSALINLGAELRLGQSFWVIVSGGVNNFFKQADSDNQKGKDPYSQLVSSIDIRYFFDKKD